MRGLFFRRYRALIFLPICSRVVLRRFGTISRKKYFSRPLMRLYIRKYVCTHIVRARDENETFNEFTFQEVTKQWPLLAINSTVWPLKIHHVKFAQ